MPIFAGLGVVIIFLAFVALNLIVGAISLIQNVIISLPNGNDSSDGSSNEGGSGWTIAFWIIGILFAIDMFLKSQIPLHNSKPPTPPAYSPSQSGTKKLSDSTSPSSAPTRPVTSENKSPVPPVPPVPFVPPVVGGSPRLVWTQREQFIYRGYAYFRTATLQQEGNQKECNFDMDDEDRSVFDKVDDKADCTRLWSLYAQQYQR